MRQTRLTESESYDAAREELRVAEIELMRHRERVAELRRRLPEGTAVEDYSLTEGPAGLDAADEPVVAARLSELFSAPGRSLVVYHLMYGKRQTSPCPMCTMWIDGFNGVAPHLAQNVDFVVVVVAAAGSEPPASRPLKNVPTPAKRTQDSCACHSPSSSPGRRGMLNGPAAGAVDPREFRDGGRGNSVMEAQGIT